MNKVVVASTRKSAGKTCLVVGIATVLKKRIGYLKPFGERLVYHKKHLWDYDSALISNTFGLKENPEDMSIGFNHSKLRYMYDEDSTREKLLESLSSIGKDKDILFVEGGKDLVDGASVYLDPLSVTKYIDGKLLLVVSGKNESWMDDIAFIKKYVDMKNINFGGVIINEVQDVEDFKQTYLDDITEMGINVIGIVPYKTELTHFSVSYLSDYLFAKVIAGERNLNNTIENIFVGAMSADAALRNPLFMKKKKLIITGGDRTDMILAALESDTACIVLTNNILPPPYIISKASDHNIPLLLVSSDTYQVAKQIDKMEPLLTKYDIERIDLLGRLIREYVNIRKIADI